MTEISTKEQIYREAFSSFYEKGYDAVSLRSVAASCGIRHNTILYYYGSKEGLANEIVNRLHRYADRDFRSFWSDYTAKHPNEDNLKYEMFAWRGVHLYLYSRDDNFSRFLLEYFKSAGTNGGPRDAARTTKTMSELLETPLEADYMKRSFAFDLSFDLLPTCARYIRSGLLDEFECFWTYFSVYKLLLLPSCNLSKREARHFYDTVLQTYKPDINCVINSLRNDMSLAENES